MACPCTHAPDQSLPCLGVQSVNVGESEAVKMPAS